jgi:hypothetical protein
MVEMRMPHWRVRVHHENKHTSQLKMRANLTNIMTTTWTYVHVSPFS